MTASQKLLIASLAVIAALAILLTGAMSSGRRMVPLAGLPTAEQGRIVSVLNGAGIDAVRSGGDVMVPVAQRSAAIAELSTSGELPDDTTILFNNLMTKQDWWQNREQHRQLSIFALQNELSSVIRSLPGVRGATVIIDAPEPGGLGRTARPATASATVHAPSGLTQDMVDAVAALVAGSRSRLTADNVRVIDGASGAVRRVTDERSRASGTYLEHAARVEADVRDKLEMLLGYIPGVTVAVTAQVDVSSVSETERRYLPKDQGSTAILRSEQTTELDEQDRRLAAEPGVRSNQGLDINQAESAAGSSLTQAEGDTQFEVAIGEVVRQKADARGMPTFLAASIGVPQRFVEGLLRDEAAAAGAADDAGEVAVTADQVRDRFGQLREDIRALIEPHVTLVASAADGTMQEVAGKIAVTMNPGGPGLAGAGAGAGGLFGMIAGGGAGGGGGLLGGGGGLVETGLVAGLAVVALGMMVMMVRKSSKPVELPTPEELTGVPQQLEGDADLFGEADESEAAMSGIEVDEDEVRSSRMLEQVREMVAAEPDKAARLLGHWIEIED